MSSKIIQARRGTVQACTVAIFMMAAFFLACGSALADMSFYANQEKGFCIEFPENWHVQQDPVVVVCATKFLSEVSSEENVPPNIKVSAAKLAGGLKLQDYYNNSTKFYSKIWKVLETKDTEIAGCPAKRVDLEQKLGIIETRVMKAFVQSGDNIFVISCSADPNAFSQYKALFESSINSFKPMAHGGSKPATESVTGEVPPADSAPKTDTTKPDALHSDAPKSGAPKAELLKLDQPNASSQPEKPAAVSK